MGPDGDRVHPRLTPAATAGALMAPGRPAAPHEDIRRTWTGPRDPGAAPRRSGGPPERPRLRSDPIAAPSLGDPTSWAANMCWEVTPRPQGPLQKPFAQLGTALSFWSAVEGGGRARVSAASLSEPGWPPACCPAPGGSRHRRTVDRPPRPRRPPAGPRRPPAGLTVLVCFPCAVFAKCPWNAPLLPAELQQERRGGG